MIKLWISLAVVIYVLIGWFVENLVIEDFEMPSLFTVLMWPCVLITLLVCWIFMAIRDLATKVREKYK